MSTVEEAGEPERRSRKLPWGCGVEGIGLDH